MEVEATILSAGGVVVGPTGRLEEALRLARKDPLDAAVLDINLNGEMVFPLAETLRRRGVPFVFMTGYEGGAVLPPSLQDAPCVSKPLRESEFVAVQYQAIKSGRASLKERGLQ